MNAGYYEDIPFEEYDLWEGLSGTGMERLRKSPMHFKHYLTAPHFSSPALELGKAVHTRILEPNEFANRYVIAPKIDRRTKAGKAAWAQFQEEAQGLDVLTDQQNWTVEQMASAIAQNPIAVQLLNIPGQIEVSMRWEDEQGVPCKGRPDKYIPQTNCFVDLKTTRDASLSGFAKSIANFGYHRKAAHIIDGNKIIGNDPIESYVFICIESEEPFATAVYYLDHESIQEGRKEVNHLKVLYERCRTENNWCAYTADDVVKIGLPYWAFKKED